MLRFRCYVSVHVCVCARIQHSVGSGCYVLNYYLIKPLSLRGSYGGRTRRYSLGSRVGNERIDLSLEGRARTACLTGCGSRGYKRGETRDFAQVKYESPSHYCYYPFDTPPTPPVSNTTRFIVF